MSAPYGTRIGSYNVWGFFPITLASLKIQHSEKEIKIHNLNIFLVATTLIQLFDSFDEKQSYIAGPNRFSIDTVRSLIAGTGLNMGYLFHGFQRVATGEEPVMCVCLG